MEYNFFRRCFPFFWGGAWKCHICRVRSGQPIHSFLCCMLEPLSPRNQCTGWFIPAFHMTYNVDYLGSMYTLLDFLNDAYFKVSHEEWFEATLNYQTVVVRCPKSNGVVSSSIHGHEMLSLLDGKNTLNMIFSVTYYLDLQNVASFDCWCDFLLSKVVSIL